MTTFNEFIESKELEEIVGIHKYTKYKKKFAEVINKAGVGSCDITDESAINKLNIGSWNWYGFFFTFIWCLYSNITSGRNNQWYFLAVIIGLYIISDFVGFSIPNGVAIGMSVVYGMAGNGFFLGEIIRRYNNGHRGIMPKSILNIFLVMGIFLLYGILSMNLYPNLYLE